MEEVRTRSFKHSNVQVDGDKSEDSGRDPLAEAGVRSLLRFVAMCHVSLPVCVWGLSDGVVYPAEHHHVGETADSEQPF